MMFWDIIDLLFDILIASIWTSILLLIFTLTSSPYNSQPAQNVFKAPNKSPRRDSLGLMSYDDANITNSENKEETKDNKDNNNKENNNSKQSQNINNDTNSKINDRMKRKYKRRRILRNYFRMFFTWFYVIPTVILSSLIVNFFQLLARISHPIFNFRTRMWLTGMFGTKWFPILMFQTEFWPNVRYRICNMNPELFKLARKKNMMVVPNHAESPFDWAAAVTFSDVLGRVSRSYSVMKRLFLMIPTVGWTGYLSGSLALHRNWEKDKLRLKEMFGLMANYYIQPWFFLVYPEGTRQNAKKLKAAQEFSRSRGYPVLENLLQPRVKGFTFFCQQLGHERGTIEYVVDMTNLYVPKPPPFEKFAFTGRLHARLDMVIRIYKIADMPKDEAGLNQWLRDRWTEKDKIIDDMMADTIEYKELYRSPLSSCLHYAAFNIFFAYILFYLFKIRSLYCILWLITGLFPILMIYVERANDSLHQFLVSADIGNIVSAGIDAFSGNIVKNLTKLQNAGDQVKDKLNQIQEKQDNVKYNLKYHQNSNRVQKLSDTDFVSLSGNDNNNNTKSNNDNSVTTSGYRNDR